MSTLQHDNTTGANDGQQVTAIEDVFDAGREYQRRLDLKATEVGNLRWAIGYRTNRLGDYLLKLGDRLCGDKPMGIQEAYDAGWARGNRKAAKA